MQSTKSAPVFWSTSNPIRNQLQDVLAQDSLLDLQTCIRIPSCHPPFWLPPFVLRFSSILTTNPINLHHSSTAALAFYICSYYLAPFLHFSIINPVHLCSISTVLLSHVFLSVRISTKIPLLSDPPLESLTLL